MKTFEPDFLTTYDHKALIGELRRISCLLPSGEPLTKSAFDALSPRASYSTIQRRFGGWKEALQAADLEHLYHGQPVSAKMRTQTPRGLTQDEIVSELRRVHAIVGTEWLTADDFNRHAITSDGVVRSRFGSFRKGLDAANIPHRPWKLRRFTDQECFENIAELWIHYGRSPNYVELRNPPSRILAKTYVERWGTWRKAKEAFVNWANSEEQSQDELSTISLTPPITTLNGSSRTEADCREVRPGLRFQVFKRDNFRCVACGRSPAIHLSVELHADHILSVANGGKTILTNLQTLCRDCNLGKGRNY